MLSKIFPNKSLAEKAIKKIKPSDIALIKLSCIAFGLMLASFIPELVEVNAYWYLLAVVVLAIKPAGIWFKK